MKTNIMQTSAQLLAPLLVASLTLGPLGCSANAGPGAGEGTKDDVATTAPAVRYDGETAFRGVFLGTGAVGERLPELHDPNVALAMQQLSAEEMATRLQSAAVRIRGEGAGSEEAAAHVDQMVADLRAGKTSPGEVLQARKAFEATTAEALIAHVRTADPTFFDRFASDFQSGDHVRVQRALEEGGRLFLQASTAEGATSGHYTPEGRCVAVIIVVVVLVALALTIVAVRDESADALHRAELVDTIATRFAAN